MLDARDKIRNAENEEERCESHNRYGECPRAKVEGSNYCAMHAGHRQLRSIEKKEIYNFQKTQFLAMSKEQSIQFNKAKYDLSGELFITRALLQKYIDKIETFEDMQMHSNTITSLMDRAHKLSESILKADQKLALLMGDDDAMQITQGLLDAVHEVLSEYLKDDNDFSKAMMVIGEAFTKVLDRNADSKE